MLCQTHIIYVCLLRAYIVQKDRIIPELESIDTIVALGYCKEGFSVVSFHSCYQVELAVQLNRTCVKYRIHTKTLHKIRICLRVHVIFPERRNMISCQNRIFITVINTIIEITLDILAVDCIFIFFHYFCVIFIKYGAHLILLITSKHILPLWYGHFHGSTIGCVSSGVPSGFTRQYHSRPFA